MGGLLTLIDLAGAVALPLGGVHMVQSGIERAADPILDRHGELRASRLRADGG